MGFLGCSGIGGGGRRLTDTRLRRTLAGVPDVVFDPRARLSCYNDLRCRMRHKWITVAARRRAISLFACSSTSEEGSVAEDRKSRRTLDLAVASLITLTLTAVLFQGMSPAGMPWTEVT